MCATFAPGSAGSSFGSPGTGTSTFFASFGPMQYLVFAAWRYTRPLEMATDP